MIRFFIKNGNNSVKFDAPTDELFDHAYAKLYDIPSTGLRFFTVYGPAGRPDMAYYGFTDKLRAGQTIKIFNYGNCQRDFTYIDDIVEGVIRIMQRSPERQTGEDGLPVAPYMVYNIGNSHPENPAFGGCGSAENRPGYRRRGGCGSGQFG